MSGKNQDLNQILPSTQSYVFFLITPQFLPRKHGLVRNRPPKVSFGLTLGIMAEESIRHTAVGLGAVDLHWSDVG